MNRLSLPLITLCLLITPILRAQIVLDAGDAPAIGDTFVYASDTTVSALVPGPGGENQSWSFSNLDIHTLDTSTVQDPMDIPGFENFPDATLALETQGVFAFLQLTPTELLNLGAIGDPIGVGQSFIINYAPPQKVLEVPTTYGTSFTDNYGFNLTVDGSFVNFDSVRYRSVVEAQVAIDGWGTLELNGETYDVLRQHTVTTSSDSIFIQVFGNWIPFTTINSTTQDYQWLSEDAKGPVFTLNFDEEGSPSSATYLIPGTVMEVAPVADFTFDDLGSGAVAFTDASANTPTSWLWDFDDGSTSTEQNPEHTYTENGTYNVCLTATNGAGSDQTCQEVDVTVTSTGEVNAGDVLRLFPNPASDQLQIQLQSYRGERLRLTVIDLNGRPVFRNTINDRQVINTRQWPAGTYLYILQQPNGRMVGTGKIEITHP